MLGCFLPTRIQNSLEFRLLTFMAMLYQMKNESLVDFLVCYIKDWKYDIFFPPKKLLKRACSFIRKFRVMHDLVIVSSISSNGQNMTTCSLFRSLPTSTRPNSIMIMTQSILLSICTWFLKFSSLKFQVWWTGFFPSLNWIFTACVACKNPV